MSDNTIDHGLWLQTPLTNNNGGQTRHWTAAYDAKLEFEIELMPFRRRSFSFLRFARH